MSEKTKAGIVMLMCAFGLMYISFYAGTLWGKACSKASDPIEIGLTTPKAGNSSGSLEYLSWDEEVEEAPPPAYLDNIEPLPQLALKVVEPKAGDLVVLNSAAPPFTEEVIVKNETPISQSLNGHLFTTGDKCEVGPGRTARVVGIVDGYALMRIPKEYYSLQFETKQRASCYRRPGKCKTTPHFVLVDGELHNEPLTDNVPEGHCPKDTYFIEDLSWLSFRQHETRELDSMIEQKLRARKAEDQLLREAGLREN